MRILFLGIGMAFVWVNMGFWTAVGVLLMCMSVASE